MTSKSGYTGVKNRQIPEQKSAPLNYEDDKLQPWLHVVELVQGASTYDEFKKATFETMQSLLGCKVIAIVLVDPTTGAFSENSQLLVAGGMRNPRNSNAGHDLVRMAEQICILTQESPWVTFNQLAATEYKSLGRMYGSGAGAPIRPAAVPGGVSQSIGAVIALWDLSSKDVVTAIQITQMLPDYARLYLKIPGNLMLRQFVWTQSDKMLPVEEKVKKFARTNFHVFLLGERGTGKTALASEIHRQSGRPQGLFWAIPCSSYSSDVLEVVFFGCKEGAYTDAKQDQIGVFEAYDNGTVFLDEIGSTSPSTQEKLLHFLQTGVFTRYGDTYPRRSNARLIFATNESLHELIQPLSPGGRPRVRRDFLDRIVHLSIVLPPLDERGAKDIETLARSFLDRCNRDHGVTIEFAPNAIMKLARVRFGCANIHLLEKYVKLAFALAFSGQKKEITDGDFVVAVENARQAQIWAPRIDTEWVNQEEEDHESFFKG
ncbi:MAG: hypothetical protein A2505_11100 [Deltaproteobacteria bacterium RIFOXYD12_FULL_55_16]|nr:MAG: hypothetical protein A2505_11100 [Deltaproteobacteria bacterium RIFOXYD12_FULL_55_16]